MKKNSLFKTLAILLLLVLVATYFISAGGNEVSFLAFKDGTASYLGFGDIIINFMQSFYYFFDTIIFVLVVGAFYGVLNKVSTYKNLINSLSSKLKEYGNEIIVVITILFALIACFTGIDLPLFIFVPFVVAVILAMGYDKLVAISSTIGGILVGGIGGLFVTFRDPNSSYSVAFQTFEGLVGLDGNFSNVVPKIILLVLSIGLLVFYILKHISRVNDGRVNYDLGEDIELDDNKKVRDKNKTTTVCLWPLIVLGGILVKYITIIIGTLANIPDTSFWIFNYASLCNVIILLATVVLIVIFGKSRKSKGFVELGIIMIGVLLLVIFGLTPWEDLFGTTVFNEIHTAVIENFTIPSFWIFDEFSLFDNILSTNFVAFGKWGTTGGFLMTMVMLMGITLLIKLVYKIKLDDILDGCIDGAKKMLPSALFIALAYTVLVCSSGDSRFIQTLITASGTNKVLQFLVIIVGSILNVDSYYSVTFVFNPILEVVTDYGNVMALAFQSLRGLVQLLAPTSLLLIVGLTYFSVPYKTWAKYIWKLVVVLFIIIFAILWIMRLL